MSKNARAPKLKSSYPRKATQATVAINPMHNAGGGVDNVDAAKRWIIANIADAVEEGALDASNANGSATNPQRACGPRFIAT
jgi:hypothetical protein